MTREEIEILQAVAEIIGAVRAQLHESAHEEQELMAALSDLEVDTHSVISLALKSAKERPR